MYDESITDFMKKAILDRVEDSIDYKEAIASKEESDGETASRKEIMSRLGLQFGGNFIMTDKERVDKIMNKYGNNFRKLSENATRKEYKEVLMFVANESNRLQRKLVGLDKQG